MTIPTTLSPFYFGLQAGLFGASGALLIGLFYGMYFKTDQTPDLLSRKLWTKGASKEKRRAPRAACNLFAELLYGQRIVGTGRVVNLSATGVCMASVLPLKVGTVVQARLPGLREGNNMIMGEIVWSTMTPLSTFYGIRLKTSVTA